MKRLCGHGYWSNMITARGHGSTENNHITRVPTALSPLVLSSSSSFCILYSVGDGVQRFRLHVVEVQPTVDVLVDLPDHADVVPSHYVETQHHLHTSLCKSSSVSKLIMLHLLHPLAGTVHSLVRLIQDEVNSLIKSLDMASEDKVNIVHVLVAHLESSNKVPAIRGDDGDGSVDVTF